MIGKTFTCTSKFLEEFHHIAPLCSAYILYVNTQVNVPAGNGLSCWLASALVSRYTSVSGVSDFVANFSEKL